MSKKITTEEWVKKAKQVHGDKYDYSKVEYTNAHTKVCIICPIHGEFWQVPNNHLHGQGCKECSSSKQRMDENEFIKKANEIHENKYDYSKVEYGKNNKTKVCIICPIHGEFWQKPNHHLMGQGCPYCNHSKKLTREEFIKKAETIHKYKYDYSKSVYKNSSTKVCIICPIHGEFWQTPNAHLMGQGCPYCNGNIKLTTEQFIEEARKVHGNKYDYSKSVYKNSSTKVCIICPIHGEFWQTPHSHLSGQGCIECTSLKPLTTSEFVEKAKQVHKDKYVYSEVVYKNSSTKVCIICPKHGEFWQTPHNHLSGQGCPYCTNSKLENEVKKILEDKNIDFVSEKTFDWLKRDGHLYLDFFLPKYNIAIECQGEQHFTPIKYFGGINTFLDRNKLDALKYKLCNEHGIKVLYYANNEHNEYFSKVYTNINHIINLINE